ncbi:MAG: YraN family protein [Ferruginibacter sp.]
MARHNDTGKKGEELAAAWFEKNGYRIIEKNWRWKRLELDIIAEKENMLHFIEVKCRSSQKFGLPEDAVSHKKIKHLLDTAEEYLNLYPSKKRIQFDVLAITIVNKDVEYFLIEDVYL